MAFWKKRGVEGGSLPERAPLRTPELPASSAALLSGDRLTDQGTVAILLDAIARVSEAREVAGLLEHIVDTAVRTTGAERGILLLETKAGELSARVARDREGQSALGERYSTSVVEKVRGTGIPVCTTVSGEGEVKLGQSVYDLKLRAVMCVPLTVRGAGGGPGQAGALYVDSRAGTRAFHEADLALFHALAQHVAIALENARRAEEEQERGRLAEALAVASEIQKGLLPRRLAAPQGYEAHGWFRPAEHASGDFYDGVLLEQGRGAFALGDVTGHGVGPALLVAAAQAGLRAWLRSTDDPARAVREVDRDLEQRMESGTFLTLALVVVGRAGELKVVDAGHGGALVWRAARGRVEGIGKSGPALGVMPGYPHEASREEPLQEGDLLLLHTDGISEVLNARGELFGVERMGEILAQVGQRGGSPAELCSALVEQAEAHGGGRVEDDWTLLALRRERQP